MFWISSVVAGRSHQRSPESTTKPAEEEKHQTTAITFVEKREV